MDQTNGLEVLAEMPMFEIVLDTKIGSLTADNGELMPTGFKNQMGMVVSDRTWEIFINWIYSYNGWKKLDTLEPYAPEVLEQSRLRALEDGFGFTAVPKTSFGKALLKMLGYKLYDAEKGPEGVDAVLFVNETFFEKNFSPVVAKTFQVQVESGLSQGETSSPTETVNVSIREVDPGEAVGSGG